MGEGMEQRPEESQGGLDRHNNLVKDSEKEQSGEKKQPKKSGVMEMKNSVQ